MGFETSVTHTIFFIATVIVAAGLAGIFTGVIYSLSDGINQQGDRISEELRTDIIILNDPTSMPYNNTTQELKIYVKNIGQSTLNHESVDILIDGSVVATLTTSVLGDSNDYWAPATVIEIDATIDLSSGDHQLKVITENGVDDTMKFRL